MSTVGYAALTNSRSASNRTVPGASASAAGVTSYVDAMAALVPAEVLTLHALVLSQTTTTTNTDGTATTVISDAATLTWAFFGLIGLSVALYVVPRLSKRDKFDWCRVFIPPAAFVVWTMLQRATAFDAVFPQLPAGPRTVVALFIAVVLGLIASVLAKKAGAASSAILVPEGE